jgi:alpha-N-arabinofuranosidase
MGKAQPALSLSISADRPGARISPAMWGIFFEDINFGADGGLCAELVKNRSFEFPEPLMGWSKISPSHARGQLSVLHDGLFAPANPSYLRIESRATAPFGVANEGFRGMGVRQGEAYHFSAHMRNVSGSPSVRVALYSAQGHVLDSVQLQGLSSAWNQYTAVLHPQSTDAKARLYVLVDGTGVVDVDMVSLCPEHTWRNRAGGLRADMVQLLADLQPGFLRFPGGCIVEGSVLDYRYQWKNTVGPVEDRKLVINRWNYEFLHRPAPDYFQSFRLGFFEFFQLCEDIGAEPLPIVNCGMACQFNSCELVPMDQLEPYVQDALDLIEFATGPVDTTWGVLRARMGHPEPFRMNMIGVGNEQWGPQYVERYKVFAAAIKARYPEIQLIAATGSDATIFPNGKAEIEYLWSEWRALGPEIVDEHFYRNPEWFTENAHLYDSFDRSGPRLLVGEYAAQSVGVASPDNRNNWQTAMSEAAFMTGLERNADLVVMSCYAPLFGHKEAWQWTPNMIWCDNLRVYGTPNYYVQKAFSTNRGDVVLPVRLSGGATESPPLFASATRDELAGEIILKVVNTSPEPVAAELRISGAGQLKSTALAMTLSGELAAENSLDEPRNVAPLSATVSGVKPEFTYTFKPCSLTVLRLGEQS